MYIMLSVEAWHQPDCLEFHNVFSRPETGIYMSRHFAVPIVCKEKLKMKKCPVSKSITEAPNHGVFVGFDKFLKLQHFSITEPMPPISEDESIVMFVTCGEGRITINGVEFPLTVGSLCWLQSYHTYTIEPLFGKKLEFAVCVYDYPLSSYLVMRSMTNPVTRAIMQAMPVIKIKEEKIEIIQRLLSEFEAENDSPGIGSSTIKVAALGQIVFFFINDCIKRSKRGELMADSDMPLGWRATLYIAERYREPLTAAGVSLEFGCTAAELNRELRRISGFNFQQSLDRMRINIATGGMFFDEISLSYLLSYSGFSTEASFYRTFKKYKGMSPKEYRALRLQSCGGYYGMVVNKTVIAVLNYIQQNYSQPITQKQIASEFYISETLLSDKFHDMFGMSVRHIISLSRVRHSEVLLINTDLPLLDIAMSVGFNSAKVFTKAFRDINGISPVEFRCQRGGKRNGKEKEQRLLSTDD